MNGTEPSAHDVAAIEDDLRERRIRVLLVNAQVSNPSTERLLDIATEASVPAIGVSETEPAGVDYTSWMLSELDCVQAALEVAAP
jgi:zinc/manganese transport system substrate-binding protein